MKGKVFVIAIVTGLLTAGVWGAGAFLQRCGLTLEDEVHRLSVASTPFLKMSKSGVLVPVDKDDREFDDIPESPLILERRNGEEVLVYKDPEIQRKAEQGAHYFCLGWKIQHKWVYVVPVLGILAMLFVAMETHRKARQREMLLLQQCLLQLNEETKPQDGNPEKESEARNG